MMVLDLSEVERVHLAFAIRSHVKWLGNNGAAVPALLHLADLIEPRQRAVRDDPEPSLSRLVRARSLSAARSARYRARRRGEVVPLRRPGKARDRDGLGLTG